jgi:hypothetical protein
MVTQELKQFLMVDDAVAVVMDEDPDNVSQSETRIDLSFRHRAVDHQVTKRSNALLTLPRHPMSLHL